MKKQNKRDVLLDSEEGEGRRERKATERKGSKNYVLQERMEY